LRKKRKCNASKEPYLAEFSALYTEQFAPKKIENSLDIETLLKTRMRKRGGRVGQGVRDI
jgi:hypothetical protein